METKSSLVVKLPVRICDTCIDVLSRWSKSPNSGSLSDYDKRSWSWSVSEEYFKNRHNDPRWVWKAKNLKNGARTCVCCRFLLQCLDSSPWMLYEDDDYIELKPRFVGSTHTNLHEIENDEAHWNRGSFRSKYDRFYRPQLQLFKKQERDNDKSLYTPGEYAFVLPQPRFEKDQEGAGIAQTFEGRFVDKTVNLSLVRQWFSTCKSEHGKSKMPKPKYWEDSHVDGCEPVPRPLIPHFRLVDVRERCVVIAEDSDQEYAALSYVWGNAKRLLLRNDNVTKLSTPGALSHENDELPYTFRDAIALAEQLGIRYLWIDAICILQDNEQVLVEHMNAMNSIYGSAVLTIVSDTSSADSGIPGIGYLREPIQAMFQCGNQHFISSKRTFGKALSNSPWESRAWCLQEKVFSRRLLVFTDTQTFYHCNCTTWFEDTIMESRGVSISIAERPSPSRKSAIGPLFTAYKAHRRLFGRNFWSLVEIYSRRQLSFESDSIRAFSGILKSIESTYGSAIWGVPRYTFAQGLTWSLSPHKVDLRRPGFPSWAWAGWRGSADSTLHFSNVLTGPSDIWDIEWCYYRLDDKGEYELTVVDDSRDPDTQGNPENRANRRVNTTSKKVRTTSPRPESSKAESLSSSAPDSPKTFLLDSNPASDTYLNNFSDTYLDSLVDNEYWKELKKTHKENHTWCLPGHPGEPDYVYQPISPFNYDPTTMPPLSHILRFYTSTATLFIDPQPDPEYKPWGVDMESPFECYRVRVPSTSKVVRRVSVDPDWLGNGKKGMFIYISRGFSPPTDFWSGDSPELLNIMLIEGDGQVKNKVRSCGMWSVDQWRMANPVWELVTLA